MSRLNYDSSYKEMCTANNGGIIILGAALLRISCSSSTGQSPTTRQMAYVTDPLDKLFLCREACVSLDSFLRAFH